MSRAHFVITIDDHLVREAEHEELRWRRRSIYKLPETVTNINKNAYTPQVVSIGPYHRKNQNLIESMEKHKDRALEHFLKRLGISLEQCVELLRQIVSDLMDAYDSLDAEFQQNPNSFLELMIRDGCFMVEIFRAWQDPNVPLDYAANDPIFSEHGKLYDKPGIVRDLLMLENQLPMMVLHKLLQLQQLQQDDANKLVFQFFFPNETETRVSSDSLHILDMYRKGILITKFRHRRGKDIIYGDGWTKRFREDKYISFRKRVKEASGVTKIKSAVELVEAGIKIERSRSRSLTEISFKKGTLKLPMITIDHLTESLFLNLVAFERYHVEAGNEVSDYVYFMGEIIRKAQDIDLLQSKNIIENGISSDEAAAELFKSLRKNITLDSNSSIGKVCRGINDYCNRAILKYRAAFLQVYVPSAIFFAVSSP